MVSDVVPVAGVMVSTFATDGWPARQCSRSVCSAVMTKSAGTGEVAQTVVGPLGGGAIESTLLFANSLLPHANDLDEMSVMIQLWGTGALAQMVCGKGTGSSLVAAKAGLAHSRILTMLVSASRRGAGCAETGECSYGGNARTILWCVMSMWHDQGACEPNGAHDREHGRVGSMPWLPGLPPGSDGKPTGKEGEGVRW